MTELNYSLKNYGREERLLLYTANKTVEARTEWVSALYSHLALYGQYSVWPLTLTITSGQHDPESLPYPYTAKSKRVRTTARAAINKSHKKW